jgi:transcriptional antiterminator RfaH
MSLAVPSRPLPSAALPFDAAAWYCLRVVARREHVAALHLRQRTGAGVFAPRIRVERGSRAAVTEALFPGYLFARFRYALESRHVASTPGVLGILRFGGPPPAIADGVIARLDAEVRRAAAAAPALAEGAWVRLIAGCFRGSEGRVVAAPPEGARVCVLLNLLGHDVRISVPRDQVADAADAGRRLTAGLRSAPPVPVAAAC